MSKFVQMDEAKRNGFKAGMSAGFIAAMMMGFFLVIYEGAEGRWIFNYFEFVGGYYLDALSELPREMLVFLGIATHFATSIFLGGVFGLLTFRVGSSAAELLAGAIFGGALWIFSTYFVIPIFNPNMLGYITDTSGWWFASHVVFGCSLGATAPLKRFLDGRGFGPPVQQI